VKFAYLRVGRVVEAGPGAAVRAGDLVYARHPHQDVFTAPVEHIGRAVVVARPPDMNPEVAVFLNLAEVAVNALLDVPVRVGDVAVVFGQGVVGLFLAQLARRTAGRLVVVDPLLARRRLGQSVIAVNQTGVFLGIQRAIPGRAGGRSSTSRRCSAPWGRSP
jgi:hypothetical protein